MSLFTEEELASFYVPAQSKSIGYRLKSSYGDEQIAEEEGLTWEDHGRSLMMGGANVAEGIGFIAKKLGFEDSGQYLQDLGSRAVEFWAEGLSDHAKQELSKQFVRESEDGSYEWGDASWDTVKLSIGQSALGTTAGMGLGGLFAKGLQLVPGVSAKAAGMLGYGSGEAAIASGSSGASVERKIEGMTHDQLLEHPEYEAAFSHLGDEEAAKELIKDAAANDAAALTALSTFVLSAPFGGVVGKYTAGLPLATTRSRSIASGAAGEAGQEFLQSGAESLAQNYAIQQYADPNQDLSEDVLNSAVGGAAAGGILGGAIGSFSPLEEVAKKQKESEFEGGDALDQAVAGSEGLLSAVQTFKPNIKERAQAQAAMGQYANMRSWQRKIDELADNPLQPSQSLPNFEADVRPLKEIINDVRNAPEFIKRMAGIQAKQAEKNKPLGLPEPPMYMDGKTFTNNGLEGMPSKVGMTDTGAKEANARFAKKLDDEASKKLSGAAKQDRLAALPENLPDERLTKPAYRDSLVAFAKSEPKKKASPRGPVDAANDDLLTAIVKNGGLSRAELEQDGFDPADLKKARVGIMPAFREKGRSVDDMAEALVQDGYLASRDVDELKEKVRAALSGERVMSSSAAMDEALNDFAEEYYTGNDTVALKDGSFDEQPQVVRQAINKALSGQKLGEREARIVTSALDMIEGGRSQKVPQALEERKQASKRRAARSLVRRAILDDAAKGKQFFKDQKEIPDPDYQEIDDSEFDSSLELSEDERIVAEALLDAKEAGIPSHVTNELAIRHDDDQAFVSAVYSHIRQAQGNGQRQQQGDTYEQVAGTEEAKTLGEASSSNEGSGTSDSESGEGRAEGNETQVVRSGQGRVEWSAKQQPPGIMPGNVNTEYSLPKQEEVADTDPSPGKEPEASSLIQDNDITTSSGAPFKTANAANLSAKSKQKKGQFKDFTIEQVEGGYVIRPGESVPNEGQSVPEWLEKDHPSKESWFKEKQDIAEERKRNYPNQPTARAMVYGPATAWTKRPLMLRIELLDTIDGANDEHKFRHKEDGAKHSALAESVKEKGFVFDSPIKIAVNHNGRAFITEGNHRVAVAKRFGVKSIPAEIEWVNGGDRIENGFSPKTIDRLFVDRSISFDSVKGSSVQVDGRAIDKVNDRIDKGLPESQVSSDYKMGRVFSGSLDKSGDGFSDQLFGQGIYLTTDIHDASDYASANTIKNRDLGARVSRLVQNSHVSRDYALNSLTNNGKDGSIYSVEYEIHSPLVLDESPHDFNIDALLDAIIQDQYLTPAQRKSLTRQLKEAKTGKDQFEILLKYNASQSLMMYRRGNDGLYYDSIILKGPWVPTRADNKKHNPVHIILPNSSPIKSRVKLEGKNIADLISERPRIKELEQASEGVKEPDATLTDDGTKSEEPPLFIENLGEKAIIVKGDTKEHKEEIKAAGGRWNLRNKGWVFPKARETHVRTKLAHLLGESGSTGQKLKASELRARNIIPKADWESDTMKLRDFARQLISEAGIKARVFRDGLGWKPAAELKAAIDSVVDWDGKAQASDQATPKSDQADTFSISNGESQRPADYGKNNKIFTEDAAAKARELLKKKLGQLNSGLDPEIMQAGMTLAGYHIEAGARKFADFAKAMISDLGGGIRPYLRGFYENVRYYPGFDNKGMSTDNEIREYLEGASNDNQSDTASNENKSEGAGALQKPKQSGVRIRNDGTGEDGASGNGGANASGSKQSGSGKRSDTDNSEVSGFALDDIEDIANGTDKQRVDANLDAIRLMKSILAENRSATNQEKAVLAKYVGWGGLSFVFDPSTSRKYAQEAHKELKTLLTKSEYNEALSSTRNAFYTSKSVVKGMWDGVEAFGLGKSRMNVLEPSIGSGNFIGWQPTLLRENSSWSATELDTVTGNIAKLIYSEANVQVRGFQDAPFKENAFTLAIGNPPFGSQTIKDDKHTDISGLSVHNYFIAKSAKLLHENGLMMMVVTNRFLDTLNKNHRTLSNIVDFVGAVRLPNTAFKSNAGTEVTTDIVVFRKLKEGEKAKNTVWTDVDGDIGGIKINKYFEQNPQNILGRLSNDGTMYGGRGGELTVHPTEEYSDLQSSISVALKDMAKGYDLSLSDEAKDKLAGEVMLSESNLPIGGMMLDKDGRVLLREDDNELGASIVEVTPETPWTSNGDMVAKVQEVLGSKDKLEELYKNELTNEKGTLKSAYSQKVFKVLQQYMDGKTSKLELTREVAKSLERSKLGKNHEKLKDILQIRNTALGLIQAEKQDLPTINQYREMLNSQYDAFASKYGTKSKPATISDSLGLLRDDISIESGLDSVSKKGKVTKHNIFSKRMIMPYSKPVKAASVDDAVNYSIQEKGRVDLGYVAEMLGISRAEAKTKLTTGENPYLLFDPSEDKYVFIDDYLSGNVKKKYQDAQAANLDKNVELLKRVLPKDKTADKVKATIRASWMDKEVFEGFLNDLGYEATVNVNRVIGQVRVARSKKVSDSELAAPFTNSHKTIPELFEAATAGKSITVFYKDGEGNSVKNVEATKQVNILVNKMAESFQTWADNNKQIKQRITKNFNDRVNTHIERGYNGRLYFRPVGQNPVIEMRKTQLDGALRMIQSKNVLLDHTVGAGKTFTAISGVMQRKRLGLSNKALVAVPNHIIGSFAADFYTLYPGANILVASEKQMSAKNRKQFFSRIATGNYDAVIVGHSHLRFLPNDFATFENVLNEKIDELRSALNEAKQQAKEEGRRGSSTKQIEDSIARLRDKIEDKKKALQESHDSIGYTFSDLGVDYMVVDEAHEFKNLTYSTSSDRVVGMNDPKGSDKALDLLVKTRAVQSLDNGGITFMTGTPISNSLVELYTVMYYLGHKDLVENNISHYDAFAGSFLSTASTLEYTSTGTVKERVVLKGLVNMKELSVKYRQFADVITRDDMVNIFAEDVTERNQKTGSNDSTRFPIPNVKGGGRRLDIAPATESQKEYNDYLIARMEAIESLSGRQERLEYASIDNPLVVMSDAKKASLDIRLVDPKLKRDPTGKVARAAKNIKEIYDKWAADKGTQLVFSDLGTPAKNAIGTAKKELANLLSMIESDAAAKKYVNDRLSFYGENDAYTNTLQDIKDKIDKGLEDGSLDSDKEDKAQDLIRELESLVLTADTGFSVYDDLRQALVELGIPENEVAFIHDYNTMDKKKELFDAVNAGDIRVLIGSSMKMGAGTNVQERLVALHHMDAPWRPSDMEQREGRIIRQGNKLYQRDPDGFEVEIIAYATQGSSDPVMWQILERKSSAIEQFRSGAMDEFVENESSDADSYAEFKAASTGNPVYREKLASDIEFAKKQTDYVAASSSKSSAKNVIDNHDRLMKKYSSQLKASESFDLGGVDLQQFKDAFASAESSYAEAMDLFEQRVEEYNKLDDDAKKDAKKPGRPSRTPIYRLKSKFSALLNEKVIEPANEAIASKVDSWSGEVKLGEKSFLVVDVEKNRLHGDKEGAYDVSVSYIFDGIAFEVFERKGLLSFTASSQVIDKLNPVSIISSKNARQLELKADIDRQERAYADAKKLVGKSNSKIKDDLNHAKLMNRWLAAEVKIADLQDTIRRNAKPNKYILADKRRNVSQGNANIATPEKKLLEHSGVEYQTFGLEFPIESFYTTALPAVNKETGKYIHLYGRKGKESGEFEVEEVVTLPEGAPKPNTEFLESPTTVFSIQPKITGAANGAPMSEMEANKVINRITRRWADGAAVVDVRDSFEDLPPMIIRQAEEYGARPDQVKGVFHFGKIYIVRDNIHSVRDLEETLFHEGYGHYGLRQLLGKEVDRELNRLFFAIGSLTGFNKIARENGIDLRPYTRGLDKMDKPTRNRVMMDELLAHIAENNKPSVKRAFKELMGAIRQFLRKMGFLKTSELNSNELLLVLKNARKAMEGKNSKVYSKNDDVRFDVEDSGPLFSIANTETDQALEKFSLNPRRRTKLSEFIDKKIAQENEESFWSMFKHRAYEGMFDGLIGIKRAEDKVGVSNLRNSGYVGARLATGIADVMHGVLHYGAPKWKDGVLQHKEGTEGLLDILGKTGADLHDFLAWVGAHRAEELMAQGRENNLTLADIEALKARARGKEALFKEVHREYKKLNDAMLDMAEEAGLINPELRKEWASDWYIPFYRNVEEESGELTLLAPRTKRGLSHQTSGIKQLKGGSMATNDLLENILANWMKLTDASMKNSALVKTVDNLNGTEYLEQVDGEGEVNYVGKKSDNNVIRIQRDGQSEYYKVHDSALLRAITHLNSPGHQDPVSKAGRYMKRLLTTGITASPDFILRNFIRDAAHAWAINPDGFKFAVDSAKGLKDALREDPVYKELMFAGASFQGGYVHGTDPEASAEIIRRALEKKGLSPSAIYAYEKSLLDTPLKGYDALKRGWQKYREFGDKIENANRIATYKAARKSGKDILQAAFESKDLMDYSLRGNFQLMQYLIDLVPFMNARLQGMSKLVRAAHENPKRVLMEAAWKIALFSVALAALNDDDERYQELPDWDKDANWHFWLGDEHYRLPKPFEIGIVFGTIPERLWHTTVGNQENEKLLWSIKHNLWETMAINPTPQFAMPIIESVANRQFFFDKPIEGMSDQGKIASARYDEHTSMTMRVFGDWLGMSPKKLEHLWNGYLGTMGMYALGVSDLVANAATDRADRPATRIEDLPVIKVLYRGDKGAKSTQYTTDVYDYWSEVDEIYRTIRAFRKEGKTEEAAALQAENSNKLKYRRSLGKARQQLGDIRDKMNKLSRNRLMDADVKRDKMDALIEQRNAIAKRYAELAEEAF